MGRKRILVRILGALFFILISSCFIPASSAKADDGTVVMTVGEKKKLKTTLKDAVWGSTNKKVAKVSAKGKVTAKAPGKCYITAVSGGSAAVFIITVNKKTETEQKLVIGLDGEYGDDVLWFYGYSFVPRKVTINEFLSALGNDFSLHYSYKPDETNIMDLDSSGIYTETIIRYIAKDMQLVATITLEPAESAYLKDMVATEITLTQEYFGGENCYYFNDAFKAVNAPSYDNFEKEVLTKFDDQYDYVRYLRNGNEFAVYITNDEFRAYSQEYSKNVKKITREPYWGEQNLTIRFIYDTSTRECTQVKIGYR